MKVAPPSTAASVFLRVWKISGLTQDALVLVP